MTTRVLEEGTAARASTKWSVSTFAERNGCTNTCKQRGAPRVHAGRAGGGGGLGYKPRAQDLLHGLPPKSLKLIYTGDLESL